LQFVREDDDLLRIRGDCVLGEPRFNPDATLDISKWSRPQHDGPAFRALALMRLWAVDALGDAARADMRTLILADLDFICRHWREPSFDIWEEEKGQHYYSMLLHYAALEDGANWAGQASVPESSHRFRIAAAAIAPVLDEFWSPKMNHYLSRRNVTNGAGGKELDFAVILAVIHAARHAGKHSVLDPRIMATLAALEGLFEELYPINRGRPCHLGPAMGRYAQDSYFSGGAYYFSTLGAAEFYYRLAGMVARGAELAATAENKQFLSALGLARYAGGQSFEELRPLAFEPLFERGDRFMAAVAAYTPASGELSEQFDQKTGAQTSAKTLTWSHAAFISAAANRKSAQEAGRLSCAQTAARRDRQA
ncbi:MAG: hypothetical protein J2P49_02250, partial [Methylocapsa sp.]|nr:hypothetical protein [Methylocapsa sp.]